MHDKEENERSDAIEKCKDDKKKQSTKKKLIFYGCELNEEDEECRVSEVTSIGKIS